MPVSLPPLSLLSLNKKELFRERARRPPLAIPERVSTRSEGLDSEYHVAIEALREPCTSAQTLKKTNNNNAIGADGRIPHASEAAERGNHHCVRKSLLSLAWPQRTRRAAEGLRPSQWSLLRGLYDFYVIFVAPYVIKYS
jgi:hypothetical protein